MEEMDTDEYCAVLEEESRKKNPEEKYQLYMAWRLDSIRQEIDKLEVFIDHLMSEIRQQ